MRRRGICVAWHTSPVKTWEDLFDKQFARRQLGRGLADGNPADDAEQIVRHQDQGDLRLRGGNEVYLAMERGEVDGRCGGLISSINSTRPDWFSQKKVAVPLQIALERDPQFPDVPAVVEFAKDNRTKQILKLFVAPTRWTGPS